MATQVLALITSCLLICSAQFIDEMQVYEVNCLGEDKFQCMNEGCVLMSQYCDGKPDCGDGSDENFCPDHHADALQCNVTHQFLCEDHKKCIPIAWLCNNEADCDDGSDETCKVLPDKLYNGTCKGFMCHDGKKCISEMWMCDGKYDCEDKSDEDIQKTCMYSFLPHTVNDGQSCEEFPSLGERKYQCLDSSYCLPKRMMCDGLVDCRDGSDEGTFCKNWSTMCTNSTCIGNDTQCTPDRNGPTCVCLVSLTLRRYNSTTNKCEDVDECKEARPKCSHMCTNSDGAYICRCDVGYMRDKFENLCYASGPEPLLFFSTNNDIRYLNLKSKEEVIIATGIKQAHGVTYDGKYVYWVETAQGHQSIIRAHLEDFSQTKQIVVSMGLEDPGDVAVDWLGGNLYFTDMERGIIGVCRFDGSLCTALNTTAKHPKYITLDVRNGIMYWADWHDGPLIMRARMDGSHPEALIDKLVHYPTGLAIDVPNDRLYFVDGTIMVIKVDDRQIYPLFQEPFHWPHAIAVFENTIYWSDWTSNAIQTTDKLHGTSQKRTLLWQPKTPVLDLHIYHPVLMKGTSNPCLAHNCSHLCLVTSAQTRACACPEGMILNNTQCYNVGNYRAQYLIVGGGPAFTRIEYNALGNPEIHGTNFDIGRVQAMAHDSRRDILYIYDGVRKIISFIPMVEFTLGVLHEFIDNGLENVVDMEYDFVSDCLFILDAGRGFVEAVSLQNNKRALVHRFRQQETSLSLCLLSELGIMLVAVRDSERGNQIFIDAMQLDGQGQRHLIMNNLQGPHVRLRFAPHMSNVYIADEGTRTIDYVHSRGTGRENYRELSTSVTSLAVTETLVFWTDRRTQRLFWSEIHETTQRIRRIQLSIFPNNTKLYLQATFPPPNPNSSIMQHPCVKSNPCSDVCVQIPNKESNVSQTLGYKCLCQPGLLLIDGKCTGLVQCKENELYCHMSNVCIPKYGRCDGKRDCEHGEDEEGCNAVIEEQSQESVSRCSLNQILCGGICIDSNKICPSATEPSNHSVPFICGPHELQCVKEPSLCVERSLVCDGRPDCPGATDEDPVICHTLNCLEHEFMCVSGSCILRSWMCDGEDDCVDGSDELQCENKACSKGMYRCRSGECIALRQRCDGRADCADLTDEDDCHEELIVHPQVQLQKCAPWEYMCEYNTSICLPLTARCNAKIECPGGSDEHGCDFRCAPHGLFACKQEATCLSLHVVCNGQRDCLDGSDETPEACNKVRKTTRVYAPVVFTSTDCRDGFRCNNGQCVEWQEVCDQTPNCFDGSDENGLCFTACENNTCGTHSTCQATPIGSRCVCARGYTGEHTCVDVDECAHDVCAQLCRNIPGSYVCGCHHGYALRSDRRSCKAVRGNMSVLYVSGNSVRSISADGHGTLEYNDPNIARITDLDYDVRRGHLYLTSPDTGKLIEMNSTRDVVAVTNVGRPTRVSVDWITGNVYFVDSQETSGYIKVCHVGRQRCATLLRLPADSQVTAFIVDPGSRRIFYCVTRELESVVWTATLAGRSNIDLHTVHNCTGLAANSFTRKLYVADTGPARIWQMDIDGNGITKFLATDPHLQAPHDLAIFEDHIYFLVANSFKLSRCLLYASKQCEPYIYRVFDANTFVLRHESVQRDDLANLCEDNVCSNICVLDENGPLCVCDNGALSNDGSCPFKNHTELPLFNGWTASDVVNSQHYGYSLMAGLLVIAAIFLCLFLYYRYFGKCHRKPLSYMPVRFRNASEGSSLTFAPTLEMPATEVPVHEFVNPLQYVKNMWNRSLRKPCRPVGTTGLSFDASLLAEDISDTESDLDVRENKRFLKK